MLKNKFIISFIILFTICTGMNAYYYPDQLIHAESKFSKINLFDPENIIKSKYYEEELIASIPNLKMNKNINIFIYIFKNMPNKYSYGSPGYKDIGKFTNDLVYLKFKANPSEEENSIFIVIAIQDNTYRLQIGEKALKYFFNFNYNKFYKDFNWIYSLDRSESSLLNMMKSIEKYIIKENKLSEFSHKIYYGFVIIMFLFTVIFFISIYRKKYRNEKILKKETEKTLNKIKNIHEDAKLEKNNCLDRICVICLNNMKKKKNKNKKTDNGESFLAAGQEIMKKQEDQIEENNNNSVEYRDMLSKLQCKHLYHAKCLTEWLSIHQVCPLCESIKNLKVNLIENESLVTLTKLLINIQTQIDSEMKDLDYTVNAGSFNWCKKSESTLPDKNDYFSDWKLD